MQADFDVVWCRGTVGDQIFAPWVKAMQAQGLKFEAGARVTEFRESGGRITGVVAGDKEYAADAVVSAVGITGFKKILQARCVCCLFLCEYVCVYVLGLGLGGGGGGCGVRKVVRWVVGVGGGVAGGGVGGMSFVCDPTSSSSGVLPCVSWGAARC